MDRHFDCTACGKCCSGWLPLTIADALAHAERFPLAMVWTPVRQGTKAFGLTSGLSAQLRLKGGGRLAVRIAPTAYIPPALPCPVLTADGLCGIHATKPARCRTMPFFPFREEADQADMLVPREGWTCDTSAKATVVYRGGRIVAAGARADFDAELAQLRAQAPVIKAYAEAILAQAPQLPDILDKVAATPGGNVVLGFATLFPHLAGADPAELAGRQLPVLNRFMDMTASLPGAAEYHARYRDWAAELEKIRS